MKQLLLLVLCLVPLTCFAQDKEDLELAYDSPEMPCLNGTNYFKKTTKKFEHLFFELNKDAVNTTLHCCGYNYHRKPQYFFKKKSRADLAPLSHTLLSGSICEGTFDGVKGEWLFCTEVASDDGSGHYNHYWVLLSELQGNIQDVTARIKEGKKRNEEKFAQKERQRSLNDVLNTLQAAIPYLLATLILCLTWAAYRSLKWIISKSRNELVSGPEIFEDDALILTVEIRRIGEKHTFQGSGYSGTVTGNTVTLSPSYGSYISKDYYLVATVRNKSQRLLSYEINMIQRDQYKRQVIEKDYLLQDVKPGEEESWRIKLWKDVLSVEISSVDVIVIDQMMQKRKESTVTTHLSLDFHR